MHTAQDTTAGIAELAELLHVAVSITYHPTPRLWAAEVGASRGCGRTPIDAVNNALSEWYVDQAWANIAAKRAATI